MHSNDTSPFVRECVSHLDLPASDLIADIPCGYGRHTVLFESLAYRVVGCDIAPERVAVTMGKITRDDNTHPFGVVADAGQPLPIRAGSVGACVIVDYVSDTLLRSSIDILRVGGYLIYQTFSARGGNWQGLPRRGHVEQLLQGVADPVIYREKPAGPALEDRVSVKALFKKTAR